MSQTTVKDDIKKIDRMKDEQGIDELMSMKKLNVEKLKRIDVRKMVMKKNEQGAQQADELKMMDLKKDELGVQQAD